jgi:DNA-binding MarR family transcriptional regulator
VNQAAPPEGGWLDEREQRAWRAFTTLQRRMIATAQRELQRDSGLSGPDYEILVHLAEAGGALRAYQLGAATEWEKSRLSHHLTRMAQRGLVERQPCAEDPRYADVVLTDVGRCAIDSAAPAHVARIREWFVRALTPEQLDAFAIACEAIVARLDPPPDGC